MIKKDKYNEWEPCYIYKERRFNRDAMPRGGNYLISNEPAERKREYTPYGGVYLIRVKYGHSYLYSYDLS